MRRQLEWLDSRVGRRVAQGALLLVSVLAPALVSSDDQVMRLVGSGLLSGTVLVVAKLVLINRQTTRALGTSTTSSVSSLVRRVDQLSVTLTDLQRRVAASEQGLLNTHEQTIDHVAVELKRQRDDVAERLAEFSSSKTERRLSDLLERVTQLDDDAQEIRQHLPDIEKSALLTRQTGPAFALLAAMRNDLTELRTELDQLAIRPAARRQSSLD